MKAVITHFSSRSLDIDLAAYLAKWQETTPRRRILHVTSHIRGISTVFGDATSVTYTFFYVE